MFIILILISFVFFVKLKYVLKWKELINQVTGNVRTSMDLEPEWQLKMAEKFLQEEELEEEGSYQLVMNSSFEEF